MYHHHHHHHVPLAWISRTPLTIRHYRPSLPAGVQGHILYQYRANVDRFKQVPQYLLVRVKGSIDYIAYEFIIISPAVSHMSCSSNLDGFRDGW